MAEGGPRVSARETAPEAYQAMAALERYVRNCGLDLNWVVVAINGWNRLAIPFRSEVGSYQPAARAQPSHTSRKAEVGR